MEEFYDETVPQASPMNIPSAGMPSGFQTQTKQLTPEMLDAIINDPTQHPKNRQDAKQMKERLFPPMKSEPEKTPEPSPHVQPTSQIQTTTPNTKKEAMVEQQTQFPISDENAFAGLMNSLSQELYSESVRLLSDPNQIVTMRALTVEEYKFLTKKLETFLAETKNNNQKEFAEMKELELSNAVDLVLEKCITNNVSVINLTMYDWIYLLLTLRCVSRPKDTTFIIRGKENREEKVTIDIHELLQYLEQNKDRFTQEIYGEIEAHNGYTIKQMQLSRFDYVYLYQNRMRYADTTLSMLLDMMSLKAFQKDNKIVLMEPEQRMQVYQTFDYEKLRQISNNFVRNNNAFLDVVNAFIRSKIPNGEALVVSDFIILFFDF